MLVFGPLRHGTSILWLDDQPNLADAVRVGGPHIAPIGKHIPKKVPSGLIHHWLGAALQTSETLRVYRG
jgi:hypothetical protein